MPLFDGLHESAQSNVIHILVIEDNPADIRLLKEALNDSNLRCELHVTMDGEEGLAFLHESGAPTPHLILLDLNLPRKNAMKF